VSCNSLVEEGYCDYVLFNTIDVSLKWSFKTIKNKLITNFDKMNPSFIIFGFKNYRFHRLVKKSKIIWI